MSSEKGDGIVLPVSTTEEVNVRPTAPTLFGRLGGLGEAVVELIVDRDLRRSELTVDTVQPGGYSQS